MSQEIYEAGMAVVGEFLDSLEERDLSEDEIREYLSSIMQATEAEANGEETSADVDFMDGRDGEKAMSAYNLTSGGALVGSRLRRKQIKFPSVNKGLFGFKGSHNPGDVWRSASGRWYTMNKDRRVVPTADPSQQQEGNNNQSTQEENPQQQLGEQGQPAPEEVKKGIMKQVGEFLNKNKGKANHILRKVKTNTFSKLHPKVRKRLKQMAAAAAWAEHKMQTFTHATQAVAQEIATEKGMSPEKVKKVVSVIKFADAAFQWTVNIPIVHHALEATGIATGMTGILASKVGGFMPVASLAYIAYSTFQDPFATALAADKIIREGIPKHGEEEHGQKPNSKQPAQSQSKAMGGAMEKEVQGAGMESENQEMGRGLNEEKSFDEASISELCDLYSDSEDSEWVSALFCAAVDHTHDPMQAVEATRAALKVYPAGPSPEEAEAELEGSESPFANRV